VKSHNYRGESLKIVSGWPTYTNDYTMNVQRLKYYLRLGSFIEDNTVSCSLLLGSFIEDNTVSCSLLLGSLYNTVGIALSSNEPVEEKS